MFIPEFILKIFRLLKKNNIECYVVGGCVRDYLLGVDPHDYDMCAGAEPDELYAILSEYKILLTGIKHGTITVIVDQKTIEITSFRTESNYSDNRHPDSVQFTKDIKKDAARRDFTINSMYFNPNIGITDLYGGAYDLKQKLIKAVGNPDKRFQEDALRIVRGVRFAIQLDFEIEENTLLAMQKNKNLLLNISSERISSELAKMLMERGFSIDKFVKYSNLLDEFVPHRAINRKNIESLCKTYELHLKFYFLYKNLDVTEISSYLKKLKLPHKLSSRIILLKQTENIKVQSEIDIIKLLAKYGADNTIFILERQNIIYSEENKYLDLLNKILEDDNAVYLPRQLAINGNDIINFGYKGEEIGNALNMLLLAVIENKIENKKR